MEFREYISSEKDCDSFVSMYFLDIMDFCQDIRKPVESLQQRTLIIQANLVEIKSIMSTWAKLPLFERKEGRKDTVLCLDERFDRKTKRYTEIETAAVKIEK